MASPTKWINSDGTSYDVGRNSVFSVDPRALAVNWTNNLSRNGEILQVDDELIQLAHDMMPQSETTDEQEGSSGQINPITVRSIGSGVYEVVLGYRRYFAAMYLIESGLCPDFRIKCITTTMNNKEAALKNMSENLMRSDPKPIQTAHAIRRLREDYGLAMEDIARRLHKSIAWCYQKLELLSLPASIQKAVDNGDVVVAAAMELARAGDEATQQDIVDELTASGQDITTESVQEKRREKGEKVKRGPKAVKEFLEKMAQDGELGNNLCSLLLDYWQGQITEDELEKTWNKFSMLITNCDASEWDTPQSFEFCG